MTSDATTRIRLKQQRPWFAAGEGFKRAIPALSDGAFKLFAWLCLEADHSNGRLQRTHGDLARAIGKSKRAVGRWVVELEAKGLCRVEAGTNQYQQTRFEICDQYWPYHRESPESSVACHASSKPADSDRSNARPLCVKGRSKAEQPASCSSRYVESIREWFLALGCVKGTFTHSDEQFARELQTRGVGLSTVENGLLLGAARKYESWLSGRPSAPIGALRYFEPVIEEAEQLPFTNDYRRYMRGKLRQYRAALSQHSHSSEAAR